MFNSKFRQELFAQIEKVEVNLRCRLSNDFSCKYGNFGYKTPENFANEVYYREISDSIKEEVVRNKKAPFIRNYIQNDRHWFEFVDTIELLFEKYSSVNIETMGFPENWKEYLI